MKMNKLFILAGIGAIGVMTSCSDDDYEKGAAATGNQLQNVTFGEDNIFEAEIDPADPKEKTITLYRDSAYLNEASIVPLKVIRNDGEVFTAPETAEFKAGSAEANITIKFDKAEIGVPYTFEIKLDDTYSNPYKSNPTYAMNIQIVKWNSLGLCEFYDTFISGKSDGGTWGYYVELQQRDETMQFRLIDPFVGANANPEDWDGGLDGQAERIFFSIMKTGDVDDEGDKFNYATFDTWETGYWYQGAYMVYAFLPSELNASLVEDDGLSRYYPDYGYIVLTPYFYIPGLGGFGEYGVYIFLPTEDQPAGVKAGDIVENGAFGANIRNNVRKETPSKSLRPSSVKNYKWWRR